MGAYVTKRQRHKGAARFSKSTAWPSCAWLLLQVEVWIEWKRPTPTCRIARAIFSQGWAAQLGANRAVRGSTCKTRAAAASRGTESSAWMVPTGSDTKRPIRKECRHQKPPAPRDGTPVRRSLLPLSRLRSAPHGCATSIPAAPTTTQMRECSCLVHKVPSRSGRGATARPQRGRRGLSNVFWPDTDNYF